MASRNYGAEDTVYVVFRKEYDRATKTWSPIAFWYSMGQSMTYGKIYAILMDPNDPTYTPPAYGDDGGPYFYSDEFDISYYNTTKRLSPSDEGYEELKEYAYEWLSKDSQGEGFDNIVERQKLDYDLISAIWRKHYQ